VSAKTITADTAPLLEKPPSLAARQRAESTQEVTYTQGV
jgi:hypothetical protein